MVSSILFAVASAMTMAFQHTEALSISNQTCKCIPGDDCWPTAQDWEAFNATISGKLVAPRQLASVCHDPNYDQAACEYIREQWTQPEIQFVPPHILTSLSGFFVACTNMVTSDESPSSIMAASVANGSCDPFTAQELPCEPGPSISYAVNATDASDFTKSIAFARDRNVRLVIRNTGHE